MFEIVPFPIPLDNDFDNRDGYILLEGPRYIVLDTNENAYSLKKSHFLGECVRYATFILCPQSIVLNKPIVPTCYVELFKYDNISKINMLCKHKMVRDILPTGLTRLTKDSYLAYRQTKMSLKCKGNEEKRISSCKFCAVSVPCGCAVNTATHNTDMYFVGCGTYTNATVDVVHPNYKIFDHKSREIQADNSRHEIALVI